MNKKDMEDVIVNLECIIIDLKKENDILNGIIEKQNKAIEKADELIELQNKIIEKLKN